MDVFEKMGLDHAGEMTLADLGLSLSQKSRSPLGCSPRAESFARGASMMYEHILMVISSEIRREVEMLDVKSSLPIETEVGIATQKGRIMALREIGGLIKSLKDQV